MVLDCTPFRLDRLQSMDGKLSTMACSIESENTATEINSPFCTFRSHLPGISRMQIDSSFPAIKLAFLPSSNIHRFGR
jgi:hypothetical protein